MIDEKGEGADVEDADDDVDDDDAEKRIVGNKFEMMEWEQQLVQMAFDTSVDFVGMPALVWE